MEPKELETYTDEELLAELAKRRGGNGATTVEAMEALAEQKTLELQHAQIEAQLSQASQNEKNEAKACPQCGRKVRVRAQQRPRTIRFTSGPVTFTRNYHFCEACSFGFYPLDTELGLLETGELSPALERRVLDFGVTTPYEEAATRWQVHYTVPISERLVRSVVERVGYGWEERSPSERQERLSRPTPASRSPLVVQLDGSMVSTRDRGWKEAKVAVLYREEHHVPGTKEQRGQITQARYLATLGGLNPFAEELDAALSAEKADEAPQVIWVGDGAPVNWNLCEEFCPNAVQILDFYHAMEHAMACGNVLHESDPEGLKKWKEELERHLLEGPFSALESFLVAKLFGASSCHQEALKKLLRYYRAHQQRMNYKQFRQQGYPIGSGAVESAHRHVIQARMKRAGQHWEYQKGDTMARLRAAYRTTGPLDFYQTVRKAA